MKKKGGLFALLAGAVAVGSIAALYAANKKKEEELKLLTCSEEELEEYLAEEDYE